MRRTPALCEGQSRLVAYEFDHLAPRRQENHSDHHKTH
jgi:hypothetical protein